MGNEIYEEMQKKIVKKTETKTYGQRKRKTKPRQH